MSTASQWVDDDTDVAAASSPYLSLGEGEVPLIRLGTDLHRIVDDAGSAIALAPDVYTRSGALVRVVPREPEPRARVDRQAGAPTIRALASASARDVLSRVARWERYDGRSGDFVATSPPAPVAEALLARGHWPHVRPLVGIATSPILRADGTVAQDPGYDASSGYLLALDEDAIAIPDNPTRAQALASRDRILGVVSDFPWATPADRSAWLALPLTILARAAIAGPTPLWLHTATNRGSGKTRLADTAAIITTGRIAARTTQPHDEAEAGKLLTAIAMEGDALVLMDNVDRPLGGGKLDAWLTGERWRDRMLGSNERTDSPITTVIVASGNNVEPRGDTIRRVLPVRLASPLERPEARTDFRIADLLGHVREHRASLAADLLTIARGWYVAGAPRFEVQPWGSYEAWCAIVPHMLRWIDLPDPMGTRSDLEAEDPTLAALRALVEGWRAVELGASAPGGLTAREIVDRIYVDGHPREEHRDVAAALEILAPGHGRERVDARRLGVVLRGARGRNVGGGARIDRAGSAHGHAIRWTVRQTGGLS